MLGAAGLGGPGGAAVAGGEDGAALADGPAGLRPGKMHGREGCSVPLAWGVQVAPPSRVARIVPLCPTAQPVSGPAKCTAERDLVGAAGLGGPGGAAVVRGQHRGVGPTTQPASGPAKCTDRRGMRRVPLGWGVQVAPPSRGGEDGAALADCPAGLGPGEMHGREGCAGAAGLGGPGGAAVAGGEDGSARADGPALPAVIHELDRSEIRSAGAATSDGGSCGGRSSFCGPFVGRRHLQRLLLLLLWLILLLLSAACCCCACRCCRGSVNGGVC